MVAGRQEEPLRAIAAEVGGRACALRHHAQGRRRGACRGGRRSVRQGRHCHQLHRLGLAREAARYDRRADRQAHGPAVQRALLLPAGVRGTHGRGRWRLDHHGLVRLGTRAAQQSCRLHRHQGRGRSARTLFCERIRQRGVRVNALAPGLTSTPDDRRGGALAGARGSVPEGIPARAHRHDAGRRKRRIVARGRRVLHDGRGAAGERRAHACAATRPSRKSTRACAPPRRKPTRQAGEPLQTVGFSAGVSTARAAGPRGNRSCGARAHRGRASGNSRPCRP